MIFTEHERKAIQAAMAATNGADDDDYKVMVVNPPSNKLPIDHSEALNGIAKAVKSVSGDDIARAIMQAVDRSAAQSSKSAALASQMIVDAIKAIPKPEKPEKPEKAEKTDLKPIIESIDRNTAALERLAAMMGAPKKIIFDKNDATKPVGLVLQKNN